MLSLRKREHRDRFDKTSCPRNFFVEDVRTIRSIASRPKHPHRSVKEIETIRRQQFSNFSFTFNAIRIFEIERSKRTKTYNYVQFEETDETVGRRTPSPRKRNTKRVTRVYRWKRSDHHVNRTLGSVASTPGCERASQSPADGLFRQSPPRAQLPGSSAAPPPPPPAQSPTTTTTIIGHYHGNRRMRILTSVQPTVSTCQVAQVLAKRLLPSTDRFHPRIFPPGKRVRGIS